jgi:ABC-type antimicrobial peptide transport system permease subunit
VVRPRNLRGGFKLRLHVDGILDPPRAARRSARYGIAFAVPYGTLIIFLGIAVAAGMLAAILPARRASMLNVLSALQYE